MSHRRIYALFLSRHAPDQLVTLPPLDPTEARANGASAASTAATGDVAADVRFDGGAKQPDVGAPAEPPAVPTERDRKADAFRANHDRTLRSPFRVYELPNAARHPTDTKVGRRHVDLTGTSSVRRGSYAYISTASDNALGLEMAGVSLTPRLGHQRIYGNGLSANSFCYPAVLTPVWLDALSSPVGMLNELEQIRILRPLKIALGIGDGTSGQATSTSSWRGRVVLFDEGVADRIDADYGVVVTGHALSSNRLAQIVIPLLISDPAYNDPTYDLVTLGPWVRHLSSTERIREGVWHLPGMLTVFEAREPLQDGFGQLSATEMARIDSLLLTRFGLNQPGL